MEDAEFGLASDPLDNETKTGQTAPMRGWDQGLGIVGLAVLATVLALLLSVGVPLLTIKEQVKLSDWLGFAGNVLGSGAALVAAAIAWRAVQRQIEIQREQILIGVLVREEDRMERELRLLKATETMLCQATMMWTGDDLASISEKLRVIGISYDRASIKADIERSAGVQAKCLALDTAVSVLVGVYRDASVYQEWFDAGCDPHYREAELAELWRKYPKPEEPLEMWLAAQTPEAKLRKAHEELWLCYLDTMGIIRDLEKQMSGYRARIAKTLASLN